MADVLVTLAVTWEVVVYWEELVLGEVAGQ